MKQGKAKHIKKVKEEKLALDTPSKFTKNFKWIIFAFSFIIYANSIQNGYNLDDTLVTQNHRLTAKELIDENGIVETISTIFKSSYYEDDMGYAYGYRPMVHVSFAIEHLIFGENPSTGHLLNTLLFAFGNVLLLRFLFRFNKNDLSPWIIIATLLFAAHPVHTEVVNSLKNRDELLAFIFAILTGIAMIRFFDEKRWLSLFWSVLFFTIALLSKKSVFPMLFIFTLGWALLRDLDVKKFSIYFITLSIPSVLIASDLVLDRIFLMTGISTLYLAGIIGITYLKDKSIPFSITSTSSVVVISLLLVGANYYYDNLIFIFILLLYYVFAIYKKSPLIHVLAPVFLLLTYLTVIDTIILNIAVLYIIYNLIQSLELKDKKTIYIHTLLLVIAIGLYIADARYSALLFIVAIVILLKLRKRFTLILTAILAIEFIVFYILDFDHYVALTVVSIPVITALINKYKPKLSELLVITAFLAILFPIEYYEDFRIQDTIENLTPSISENTIKEVMSETYLPEDDNFIKEGRMLQPIENTLVLPHTKSEKIATGFATMGEYFRLMTFPYELSFYYGYAKTKTENLTSGWVWFSIIIHLLMVFTALFFIRKQPIITFGIAWYLGAILLFSNWVELVAGMVGERLAFAASAGFCLAIGGIIQWAYGNFNLRKPKTMEWSFLVVLALFSFRTIARNSDWVDIKTLMLNDIEHLEDSAQANNLLAGSLMNFAVDRENGLNQTEIRDYTKQAILYYDKALEVWPGFFNAAYDKGRAAMIIGDTATAVKGFERAVEIENPGFLFPYYNLQDIYLKQRELDKYKAINRQLLVLDSLNVKIYSHMANSYFLHNEIDSAEYILNIAAQKFPDNEAIQLNLQEIASRKQQ